MTGLTAPERETVITMNDEDDTARIFTHQTSVITKLKNNPAAVLLQEGRHGTTKWAEFELPCPLVSFRTKRRTASVAQRAAGTANIDNNRRAA